MSQALKICGLTKRFASVVACNNISLEVDKGQILAIAGENGAGKSTLMNMLYGHLRPDEGEIFVNGKKEKIDCVEKAIQLGIGMVFQHFMLVPNLTVYENIILGREPRKGLAIDKKQAIATCQALAEEHGIDVDVTAKVENLSLGVQQRVEILKTLYRKAEILILDEPTAVLTPAESEELFRTMQDFAKKGKTIIFITHKLQEVLAFSDLITVIRRGEVVGTIPNQGVTREQIAQMMVGRPVVLQVEKQALSRGEELVRVTDLSCDARRKNGRLQDIHFTIHRGEVFGIAGIEGNGQTELLEILQGLKKPKTGSVTVGDTVVSGLSPRKIRDHKIIHIPEDRHDRGLVLEHSVQSNLILGIQSRMPFSRRGILRSKEIDQNAETLIKKYDIRCGGRQLPAASLSGGNQQKIIIAREFEQDHDFLIAAQPTRGVDVGAIEFIHKQILRSRDAGKAILLVSADLQEILSLSDRIAILYEGRFVGIVDAKQTNELELGLMMGGSNEQVV